MIKKIQNFNTKTNAMPHQCEAISYIVKNKNIALFDEQGLGKTKIVIDSLSYLLKEQLIEGVLVIAPMSLLYNWEMEVEKHSFLIPNVLKGTDKEKRFKYLTGANFYIINYESVISELQTIKRFCKSYEVSIVLDESARIKNPESKTTEAVFELIDLSIKRIIISGTPVANKPYDLWAQFYFLDKGELLGKDFNKFKAMYSEKNANYKSNINQLKEIVKNNSIRRTKNNELDLPEKKYIREDVVLAGKQLEIYEQLRKELVLEVKNIKGDTIIDESSNLLKKLLRLTQITSNPYLIDKSYSETPVKYIALDKIIETIISTNEKLLVWTSFVENIVLLKLRYKKYKPLVIFGDVPIKDRAEYIKTFQESDINKIMILNPSAAREGITLTKANHAIYLDRNFNLVDYLQSQDRIHRISQDKVCTIYKIIAKNTIDEYIESHVDAKSDIASFIQGDKPELKNETFDFLTNKKELLSILGG